MIGNRLVSVGHTAGTASDLDVRVFDTRTGARVWEDRHDVAGGLDYALTVAAGGPGSSRPAPAPRPRVPSTR